MKSALKHLNGYYKRKKNHFDLFKEDKTKFNGEKL